MTSHTRRQDTSMNFDLFNRTILLVVGGSRAYGISTEASDVDVKGVAIPTVEYFHGYLNRFEQADQTSYIGAFAPVLNEVEKAVVVATKLEGSIYDVRKFINLAAGANPNILDVLFCRDEEVRLTSRLGDKLRENRDLFLSAAAKHTFSGYSAEQMRRVRTHRRWLLAPVERQPLRADFGLPENTLIPADQLAAARAAVQKKVDGWEFDFHALPDAEIIHVTNQIVEHLTEIRVNLGFASIDDAKWLAAARSIGLDTNLIHVMQREREYEAAHRGWKQYQEWKKKRNPERAALEEKHGYDTKHAAHLFRLLRMCREILETGKVNVWRGGIDAEEILSIRRGAWSYDKLVEWAEAEDAALEALYAERKYVVPKAPDRKAIDRLCIELVETALSDGIVR